VIAFLCLFLAFLYFTIEDDGHCAIVFVSGVFLVLHDSGGPVPVLVVFGLCFHGG
jgi:hypothetical protein